MKSKEFNNGDPLAYFITWTTYGTWLPGDERGWIRKGVGGIQSPNPRLENAAKMEMTETAFVMSDQHRDVVAETVRRHCEIRGWYLHVVNPRTNHVHVVVTVTATGYTPKTVREQFQAWCTRKLKTHVPKREHFWTEGGSGRYVNTEDDLERVILYASEAQDRKQHETE